MIPSMYRRSSRVASKPSAMVKTIGDVDEDIDLQAGGGHTGAFNDFTSIKRVENILETGNNEDISFLSLLDSNDRHLKW
jgi:hypothetical protein